MDLPLKILNLEDIESYSFRPQQLFNITQDRTTGIFTFNTYIAAPFEAFEETDLIQNLYNMPPNDRIKDGVIQYHNNQKRSDRVNDYGFDNSIRPA